MDEQIILLGLALVLITLIVSAIVLPIVALLISIRTRKKLSETIARLEVAQSSTSPRVRAESEVSLAHNVQELQERIQRLEVALKAHDIILPEIAQEAKTAPQAPPVGPAPPPKPVAPGLPPPVAKQPRARALHADQIESMIGRRWLGWAAVGLILFAAAFFLKYAFENRWIGELGRVAIGVSSGVVLTSLGFKYYRRGWVIFSQILTAGGIVLLYLSAYAAFGYYHLVPQKAAFVYLALLVAEAAALALIYNAPAIAIMAVLGGFLTPILLHSDRDQYRSLFGYIVAIDLGALALLKHWRGLRSLAFAGTHALFWLWYVENYHPRKLGAVMIFQSAVFLIFLLAHLGLRVFKKNQGTTLEDIGLLLVNPFVFFATAYHLLNPNHHDWMGVFAIGMALLIAGSAKVLLDRSATTRYELLSLIAVALTFVTLAIPIQLSANWITIAWSVEALTMLWAGMETKSQKLRALSCVLFALALVRLVFWDTPNHGWVLFTPIVNKYFLSSMVVTACLFGAAALYKRTSTQKQISAPMPTLVLLLVAAITFWFVISVETHSFFEARAAAQKLADDAKHERWLGQMALSVIWASYATALAAIGFLRRSASIRWASLALFTLTIIKAMLVDIAELQQLYRIVVFFVLGVLLLMVAWGYHKAFQFKESQK